MTTTAAAPSVIFVLAAKGNAVDQGDQSGP